MIVEWLFELENSDTFYAWSTKDVEYNGVFYRGIIEADSFSGISESQSISNGIQTPVDTQFRVLLTNSILKDSDYLNIFEESGDDLIEDSASEFLESEFNNTIATIKLLVNGSLSKSWKFKVKRVEQCYKKALFWLESILTGYLEGDFPNTLHPREIWKTELERSDDYIVPYSFGKAYCPLRSIYDGTKRYYLLGKDSYNYSIDRVSSPKEWPNSSFWDDTYSYPQSTSKGYQVFQAIIADSDGDLEVDANGLWKDGEFFYDMPTRFTCDSVPFNSRGANPADVIEFVLLEMGIDASLIDSTGTFTDAKNTYESWGLYWNGGIYNQQSRQSILSSLLAQCNSTIRVTDKIELLPIDSNPTLSTISLNRQDIVKDTYSVRPSWPSASDGGYIKFPADDTVPQDNLTEALVWSNSKQASADDVNNPSSSTLELPFVRDSVLAQKLGIVHFNRKLDVRGNISFTLMPKENYYEFAANKVISIQDDLYGNTADVLINSVTLKEDLTLQIEATKFVEGVLGIGDVNPDPVILETEDAPQAWSPITSDEMLPSREISLISSMSTIPFKNENDPLYSTFDLTSVVSKLEAHSGVRLEISEAGQPSYSIDMPSVGGSEYSYTYSVGNYGSFPISFTATAYKIDSGTGSEVDLISKSTTVHGILNGVSGYTLSMSKSSYQILCDSEGSPIAGELGSTGNAVSKITVIKGDSYLTPVSSIPGKNEFMLEVGTGVGCTGGLDTDNQTVYIETVTTDTGYLPIAIYLESTSATTTTMFSFVKSKIGRRGSIAYSLTSSNSTLVNNWINGNLTNTQASTVAELVISNEANADDNIVPGDRVTLQLSTDSSKIATRIYQGLTKVSGDPFSANDWSSKVVETIDGSLIVKGTLAADSLIANDTLTNNLTVGSFLTVGDASYTNAIIKSYNYNSGVAGWAIKGDGTAEFQNGTFRGNIKIGNASEVRTDINVAKGADVTKDAIRAIPLSSFSQDVQNEFNSLITQVDNKLSVYVQETTPGWTDANSNHIDDHWYKPSTLKWYRYTGTAWTEQDNSIYNLKDLANSKTTYHYTSVYTGAPPSATGVVGDFAVNRQYGYTPDVFSLWEKTGASTWTARSGTWVDGSDKTSSNPQDYSWVTGTKPPTNADNTQSKLDLGASIDKAKANGTTLIEGGYINTGLVLASRLVAGTIDAKISISSAGYVKATSDTTSSGFNFLGYAVHSAVIGSTTKGANNPYYAGVTGTASGTDGYYQMGVCGIATGRFGTGVAAYSTGSLSSALHAVGESIGAEIRSYNNHGCVSSGGPGYYDFYAAGAGGDSTTLTGSFGPFTGSHDGVILKTMQYTPGDIIVDVRVLNKANVSDVIAENELSSIPKQKSVFGVMVADTTPSLNDSEQELKEQLISAATYDEFMSVLKLAKGIPAGILNRYYEPLDDTTFQVVRDNLVEMLEYYKLSICNSVGEGCMNVVSEGGDIEAGDYICSSSTPGKGMKQDDDLLHNYTVAKSREDVVWTQEEIDNNVVKVIACTYHCG